MSVPALIALTACGSPTEAAPAAEAPASEATGRAESALIGGVMDDDAHALDAVVALRIGDGSPFDLCTGTLIAPNVVLTARHCVAHDTRSEIDCKEDGRAAGGPQVGGDVSPRSVRVLLGAKPDFNGKPAALGKTIFRPTGDVICNSDIAIVVLDRAIPNAKPIPVRLASSVHAGETVRAIGYGQNDKSQRLGTRFRKEGIRVLATGPVPRDGQTGRPAIAHAEFEVGRSICQGDSGGPALSEETLAIVGVVSRGVDCNTDWGHIYTKTSGFQKLFDAAFAEAGGAPLEEGVAVATAVDAPGTATVTGAGDEDPAAAPLTTKDSGCATAPAREDRSFVSAGLAVVALAAARRRRRGRA